MKVKSFIGACAVMFAIGFGVSAWAARPAGDTEVTPEMAACLHNCSRSSDACWECCVIQHKLAC